MGDFLLGNVSNITVAMGYGMLGKGRVLTMKDPLFVYLLIRYSKSVKFLITSPVAGCINHWSFEFHLNPITYTNFFFIFISP